MGFAYSMAKCLTLYWILVSNDTLKIDKSRLLIARLRGIWSVLINLSEIFYVSYSEKDHTIDRCN